MSYLDDVNLSTGRPGTRLRKGPKGWPGSTPIRHMLEVEDDDGFIEGLLGANSVAISPTSPADSRVDDVLRIWEHEEFVLGGCLEALKCQPQQKKGRRTISKVLSFRFLQAQVVDPSMGRIVLRLPVELFEKIGADNRECTFITRRPAAHET